jgi:hypothetical protein
MLRVRIPSAIMLNVVMLNVIMVSFVVPFFNRYKYVPLLPGSLISSFLRGGEIKLFTIGAFSVARHSSSLIFTSKAMLIS